MSRGWTAGVAAGWLSATLLSACTPAAAPESAPPEPAPASSPVAFVTTEPPGAAVTVNGQKRGSSPVESPLVAGRANTIRAELDGYLPMEVSRTPNGYERLLVSLPLKAAARLVVKSEPPGARVLANRTEVLAKTPGTTSPLAVGEVDVLVLLDGFQAQRRTLTLPAGETSLELTLARGVKLAVTSTPAQADILLDGAWVGTTPSDVYLPPKGRHTVEVKKDGWGPVRKLFVNPNAAGSLDAKLEEVDLAAARKAVERAQARHDTLSAALQKVQAQVEQVHFVPEALERRKEQLERDVDQAASALDQAERELENLEAARAAAGQSGADAPR